MSLLSSIMKPCKKPWKPSWTETTKVIFPQFVSCQGSLMGSQFLNTFDNYFPFEIHKNLLTGPPWTMLFFPNGPVLILLEIIEILGRSAIIVIAHIVRLTTTRLVKCRDISVLAITTLKILINKINSNIHSYLKLIICFFTISEHLIYWNP